MPLEQSVTVMTQPDRFLIIELFAKRRRSYGHDDVVRLTRSSEAEVAAAVSAGDLEPHRSHGQLLYTWEEVANFALRRWTPRMIAAALGSAHAGAFPALNRVASIQVQLPLYQVRMLHVLADAEGDGFRGRLNASDIVEQQLADLANGVDADEMEEAIPGFRAALRYPELMEHENPNVIACRFCGRLAEDVCTGCKERHWGG